MRPPRDAPNPPIRRLPAHRLPPLLGIDQALGLQRVEVVTDGDGLDAYTLGQLGNGGRARRAERLKDGPPRVVDGLSGCGDQSLILHTDSIAFPSGSVNISDNYHSN